MSAPASSSISAETSELRPRSSGKSIALLLLAAAAIGGALFFVRTKPLQVVLHEATPIPSGGEPSRAAPANGEGVAAPVQEAPPVVEAPASVQAPGPAAAAPTASEATPHQAPANVAEPLGASEPTPNSDVIVVTVNTIPADARFFYKGKAVGRSPFRVELKPGERRAFEIGRPGFFARKVVVDGTKTEFTVSMRPDPTTAP